MTFTSKDFDDLQVLIDNLTKYKKKLININSTHDRKQFFDTMKEFREYLACITDEKLCDLFSHSIHYNTFKEFFREKNYFYMRAIECVEAFSIMTKWEHWSSNFIDLIDKDYIQTRYQKKVNELKSIDFTGATNMVCVWCWPMPETILFIYENTEIDNIIWIDNSSEAIYIAWEMIRSLSLENINLVHINWEEYDYSDADIVYIPWFVYPKNPILDRIVETWKDNVQILVDSSLYLQKMLFDDVWEDCNQRLKITNVNKSDSQYYKQNMIKFEKYNF